MITGLFKRITRKFLRAIAYILGGIIVLLVSFHFWFINHAEELIEDLVSSQSNGKLKLEVKKFKFNWFSRKIELRDAVFYSTDTNSNVSYRFQVPRLRLQVKAVFPIIFEKKFYIDSLHLINPDISVTRIRSARDSLESADTTLSLPQEMGRIYNSIQDALQVLKVDRFQIDNGKFSLINKESPDQQPVRITNLFFHLDNLLVDSSEGKTDQKILFSDDISLHTFNQDILFPDGRHRLSFSNFRINIRNKMAEFDSCTILATKGDSSNSSFRIFFDKLKMTNIDFDTLYHSEVIKADSVFCINPRFRLDVDLEKRSGPVKPPKLNELIQQLTGDMQLAFVVVQNGSFDINTVREGRPSSFTSDNNNFELQGLQIRKDAPRPLVVERFAMAIRNYENFLRDSTYAIQFDSILINNNRISLSNFSYQELKNNHPVNALGMPQFELYGLSWDDLVFDQQLKANRVTLYQPIITYDFTQDKRKTPRNVFDALAGIGNILQLKNLNIVDGQINLRFRNNTQLKFEDATMFLLGERLVASKQLTGIRKSVDLLNFKRATLRIGDISAELNDVKFRGSDNHIQAGSLIIRNKEAVAVNAKGVSINSMILDDQVKRITLDGLKWDQADIRMQALKGKGGSNTDLVIQNILGKNTLFVNETRRRKLRIQLDRIAADRLSLPIGKPISVSGFNATGRELVLTDSMSTLTVAELSLADQQVSTLRDIWYNRKDRNDSVQIIIPQLAATPDIAALLSGKINADDVTITNPVIRMQVTRHEQTGDSMPALPTININRLRILQPDLDFAQASEQGRSLIRWIGTADPDSIELEQVQISDHSGANIQVGKLRFSLGSFKHTNPNGKTFDTRSGQLAANMYDLQLQKNDNGGWDWHGVIGKLTAKDFVIDSIGKKFGKLNIERASLEELSINSADLPNLREVVRHNARFRLREVTGSYVDTSGMVHWNNVAFDKSSRMLTLDSFAYRPRADRDTYIKQQPYQADYIIVRTGRFSAGPIDIDRFISDSTLSISKATLNNSYLSDFRDQQKPREPGVVRALPANLIREIPIRLRVDTIRVNEAFVEYEEVSAKGASGKVALTHLNAELTNLRNFDIRKDDSLKTVATAMLQDKLLTKLRNSESYSDSLGGFLMTGQMGPGDLRALNPVLIALASAELKSLQLDSMTMRVTGREALAYGEMNMYYHDLKIRILKNGDRKKKPFLTSLLNFAANTIVKNKNTDRKGTIFFRRLRDRSAFNYLVKIAISGVGSSVGLKKNKRLARRARKEILSKELPPVQPISLESQGSGER